MTIAKSHTLLLTICSNRKTEGGSSTYAPTDTVAHSIPEREARNLYASRRYIRSLITGNEVTRNRRFLRDLPYNQDLVDGPDIRPASTTRGGQYLPAASRYRGRFIPSLVRTGSIS